MSNWFLSGKIMKNTVDLNYYFLPNKSLELCENSSIGWTEIPSLAFLQFHFCIEILSLDQSPTHNQEEMLCRSHVEIRSDNLISFHARSLEG